MKKAWELIKLLAVFAIPVWGIVSCQNSDWAKENERLNRERQKRLETPHVIREADGCKVYAWKSGEHFHYFTRCPNATTTTDRTFEDCHNSGKHRSCQTKTESIVAITN